MSQTDAPVQIQTSRYLRGVKPFRIKRGSGNGGCNNSSTPGKRFHAPIWARRDFKKPGKKVGEFRQLPRPPHGVLFWNPTDPLIIEFQKIRTSGVIPDWHAGMPHIPLHLLMTGKKMIVRMGGDQIQGGVHAKNQNA